MRTRDPFLFLTVLLLLATQTSQGQTSFSDSDFEHQILYYEPEQRVSDKAYSYAQMILRETKSATDNNPSNFNVADYFNVLSAFLTLNESQENIDLAFKKFVNADGSCEYLTSFEKKVAETPKYDPVREAYLIELRRCKADPDLHKAFDPDSYADEYGLDASLVKVMHMIKLKDQQHRDGSGDIDPRQKALDKENQELINRIYEDRKAYIGRSLVGEKLEYVMWSVIQHSNPDMMKKYLPVVHEAVKTDELDLGPLKMLLDRYYAIIEGYQFFGSQVGVKLADEKVRQDILQMYELH